MSVPSINSLQGTNRESQADLAEPTFSDAVGSSTPRLHPMTAENGETIRVLLVEDSLVNQKLLTGLLERWDCSVTLVLNGQQAVDRMAEEEFDVVLMDVQMPVMDGLTATRLIRRHEKLTKRHTPIVAVTAGMDRASCLAAGMDEYMSKPVRPEAIRDFLQGALGDRRLRQRSQE